MTGARVCAREEGVMTERRDFGRMAAQMRSALDQYSREELADLLVHLTRAYVVEGNAPVSLDTSHGGGLDDLRDLSFPQLILHLQMNLPHEELRRFQVSGGRVWVEHQGREVALAGGEVALELPPDAELIAPELVEPRGGRREERGATGLREVPAARRDEATRREESTRREDTARREETTRRDLEERWDEPAPRVERVELRPELWDEPTPRVVREAAPGVVAPRREAPTREGAVTRESAAAVSSGVRVEDAGRVERPSVGLREQGDASPRRPPTTQPAAMTQRRAGWSSEPTSDEPRRPSQEGAKGKEKDSAKDEVGDVSGRFSMLELD